MIPCSMRENTVYLLEGRRSLPSSRTSITAMLGSWALTSESICSESLVGVMRLSVATEAIFEEFVKKREVSFESDIRCY